MFGSIQDNAVVYARTVEKNGVQTTTPVNMNGVWYAQTGGGVNKEFRLHTDWKFTTGVRLWATYNRDHIILNQSQSVVDNLWLNPEIILSLNAQDRFEFGQNFRVNWRKSTYRDKIFPAIQSTSYNPVSEVIVRAPKQWVWETSIDYLQNPQVSPGIQKDMVRWSAGVNFLLLKEDRAQLKLSVFDLLNRNKQVYTTISENRIEDFETTVLRRYGMLTFTYNFRKFG